MKKEKHKCEHHHYNIGEEVEHGANFLLGSVANYFNERYQGKVNEETMFIAINVVEDFVIAFVQMAFY